MVKFTPQECFGCSQDNEACAKTKDFISMPKKYPDEDLDNEFGVTLVSCKDYTPRDNLDQTHMMRIQYQEDGK